MTASQTIEGTSLPSLKLVIHYEYQLRKEAMDKGKSKGKRGKNKPKSGALHRSTPDGRQLCFAWNNSQEGCKGGCGRAHACRICLDPSHPTYEHPSDSKSSA